MVGIGGLFSTEVFVVGIGGLFSTEVFVVGIGGLFSSATSVFVGDVFRAER